MTPHPTMQITINSRSAVILSIHETPDLWSIACFWPGTSHPPIVSGLTRPGSWSSKVRVLLFSPATGVWYWDPRGQAIVAANSNPRTFVDLEAWLRAFAQEVRTYATA